MALRAMLALLGVSASQAVAPPPQSSPPQIIARNDTDVVDEQEIVLLAETRSDFAAAVRRGASRGYRLERWDDLSASLGLFQLVFTAPPGRRGSVAIREMEALAPGTTVGVNHAFRPQAGSSQGRRYAERTIRWPARACPTVRPIGVIDTATNLGLPIYRGTDVRQHLFIPNAQMGHGDEVVSVLLSRSMLAAPRIYVAGVVRTESAAGAAAGVDAIVRALGWLRENGVHLVNISLAGPYNRILDVAIQRASARGMLLVAAAGNTGAASPLRYPAAFPGVIATTAVDAERRAYPNAVQGRHVAIAAPGVDIFIAVNERYRSGTSFAAPYVTAYFAARGGALPDVASARRLLSRHAIDLGTRGYDPVFGWGLLDASDAC